MKVCERGTLKLYERNTFCQNGIQKGKGLELGVKAPHVKLCPPPWELKKMKNKRESHH